MTTRAALNPLKGKTILDLTQLLPGPYATLLLAELGAEIIKVEPPEGDPLRWLPPISPEGEGAAFATLNRGKKSVALNLKDEFQYRRFLNLAQHADAVIEGFRPGVVKRLKVDYAAIKAANPDIVYCSLSGYGQTGPWKDAVGHDLNYVALAGVLRQTNENKPSLPGFQIGDINGGLFAALSLMGALWQRDVTGKGQYLDIAMTDCVVHGLALHFSPLFNGQSQSSDSPLGGQYPFYTAYKTKDDRWLSVGCLEPKFWAALCKALGVESLISKQFEEGAARQETMTILEQIFLKETLEHWLDILDPRKIPVAPVHSLEDAIIHPQLQARQLFQARALRAPFAALEPQHTLPPAPTLGQHNDELLADR